ncbi:MAG: carboxylating nicotinate-nucleotide diphosphorylase [Desulfatibacillaceae bacterium]
MPGTDTNRHYGADRFAPEFSSNGLVQRLVDLALDEDIGTGDVTTRTVIPENARGRAVILAKEPLVVAGLDMARMVFKRVGPEVAFTAVARDGDHVLDMVPLVELSGSLRQLLIGERTALNFLQRMSGVATHVRAYVEALGDSGVRLVDTRKTTPGWRLLEKYAVRVGGAGNHRMGLFDAVLIKDNHIAVCGGITEAVRRARAGAPFMHRVEVECENMAQVAEAVEAGADVVMLDNMDNDAIAGAVREIAGRAMVEVSGRITRERLAKLAGLGVDVVSSGALTYAATAVDISMDVYPG